MFDGIRYLLLQVRNPDDPMRSQEIGCFARTLRCPREQIRAVDLLSGVPTVEQLDAVDVVLLGGSGDYSVAEGGDWLGVALEAMRELYDLAKPTFASCWGFQAMAKAMGGEVVTDLGRAELGTVPMRLTAAGRKDPVFGALGDTFEVGIGHQDIVVRLPENAVRLASTDIVENQAYCFKGKPIYCTQFLPELNRKEFLERVYAYPQYVEKIVGVTLEEFSKTCRETPESEALLRRFVQHVFG